MESSAIDKCAACGTEGGDSLKACMACHMVKYYNRDCQISHRKQHKKECKKRAAELYDEKLFKEVEPEECPICFRPFPLDASHTVFKTCCGKLIFKGCIYAMDMSEGGAEKCAFCRTPEIDKPIDDEEKEHIKRLKKLMDKGDAGAFNHLAGLYSQGISGMPQDDVKAKELWLKAGELGCADAYLHLAVWVYELGRGGAIDEKKAKHYYELAAMKGSLDARHNLARLEGKAGNHKRGFKHLIMAARAGSKESLNAVKKGFERGLISKDEYEDTLRSHHARQKEMKSDQRDEANTASGM